MPASDALASRLRAQGAPESHINRLNGLVALAGSEPGWSVTGSACATQPPLGGTLKFSAIRCSARRKTDPALSAQACNSGRHLGKAQWPRIVKRREAALGSASAAEDSMCLTMAGDARVWSTICKVESNDFQIHNF